MNRRNIFAILEIEPTKDKKVIKKAYAKLVKKYHPEEYPEKWKEIHEAYEAAIAWTQWQDQDFPVFSAMDKENEEDLKPPKPVIKAGKAETLKSSEESDGLESLFDHIDTLSKEQQEHDKEAYEKEFQEVMHSFEKISGKKKPNRKEWEDFFSPKARLPYLCNREFLKMLGEYFSNKRINAGMYQFLMEQLEVIKAYCLDRNIVLQTISALDPVKYAEIRICGAYSRGKGGVPAGMFRTAAGAFKKIVIAILVIDVIIIGLNIWNTGLARKEAEDAKFREIAEEKRAELVTYNNDLAHPDITGLPERPPQIGDTKEQMLEWFGEPEQLLVSEEDSDHEEAVYLPGSGIRIVIILDKEIITDIQTEYVTK